MKRFVEKARVVATKGRKPYHKAHNSFNGSLSHGRLLQNPFLQISEVQNILGNIPFQNLYDKGREAETYYFRTYINSIILGKLLIPGKYVLKIYRPKYKLQEALQKYLLKLSKHKLIPKIHIINQDFIIMDYFDGLRLETIIYSRLVSRKDFDIIFENIKKLLEKYRSLKFRHNDFHYENILVDKNLNVMFIDPQISLFGNENIWEELDRIVLLADENLI